MPTTKQVAKAFKPTGDTTLDALLLARRLLARAGGWTKGTMARGKRGNMLAVDSPTACSFCALGAIRRARLELGRPSILPIEDDRVLDCIPKHYRHAGIMGFNDNPDTKKSDVLKAFSCAISRRRERIKLEKA